jgi:GrpB-like predicted nucleotidyltransferase (UPF0157 family)
MQHAAKSEILIGGVERVPIKLCDHDPSWREVYEAHAQRVRDALGEVSLRIEHIGSTSVIGLSAKPIVDILLVVADAALEDVYLPPLVVAGYELRVREPEFHEHRMFRTPSRDVHLHVFSPSSPEIERYLTFRDRLRTSPFDRRRYEETKRALAAQAWPNMNAYAAAKSEVVESILAAAREAGELSS